MKTLILITSLCFAHVVWAQETGVDMMHLKINQDETQMQTIRGFYKHVMGLSIYEVPGKVTRDFITFDNGQRLNLIYMTADKVLTDEEFMKGLWIRIETDRFEEVRRNIVRGETGRVIKEVPGKELYFQAPGGQVWRMVKKE